MIIVYTLLGCRHGRPQFLLLCILLQNIVGSTYTECTQLLLEAYYQAFGWYCFVSVRTVPAHSLNYSENALLLKDL